MAALTTATDGGRGTPIPRPSGARPDSKQAAEAEYLRTLGGPIPGGSRKS